MQFAQWLAQSGTRQADAARALGVSPAHMADIVNGRQTPGARLARRIEIWTKGEVLLKDFIPDGSLGEARGPRGVACAPFTNTKIEHLGKKGHS